MKYLKLIFILFFLLTGCTPGVHDVDSIKRSLNTPSAWQGKYSENLLTSGKDNRLSLDFHDPVLEGFLFTLVNNNLNLAAAAFQIKEAAYLLELNQSDKNPLFTASVGESLSKQWNTGQPSQRVWSTSQQITYEVDLWGKIAASTNSAQFEKIATEYDYLELKLKMVATFVELYWRQQYYLQYLQLLDKEISHAQYLQKLSQALHRVGNGTRLDVIESQIRVDNLQRNRATTLHAKEEGSRALGLLLGSVPDISLADNIHNNDVMPEIRLPALLPATLPSRRPDLKAAEARLRQSFSKIEETRLSIYPTFSLSLTQSTGNNRNLSDILKDPLVTLSHTITFPFLQYPQVKQKLKISQVQYEKNVFDFQNAYYNALKEVEDIISDNAYYEQNDQKLSQTLEKNKAVINIVERSYREGLISYKDLEEQRQQLINHQYEMLDNKINLKVSLLKLYISLGGDEQDSE